MASEADWLKYRKQYLKGKKNHQGYYECERCGKWIEYPEVDHIQKRSLRPDLVIGHPENLRVLCHDCHLKVNPDYNLK